LLSALLICVVEPLSGTCFALPEVEFMFEKLVILLELLVPLFWFLPVEPVLVLRLADDLSLGSPAWASPDLL
jgi:hypothetical protein